uniref:Transmembrane protein n=1 Tax=Pediastrum duplex TaxID=3105 RepID=A0A2U8GIE8_PEDDU|nr:hypothetical protein [Pediastrum duplex]
MLFIITKIYNNSIFFSFVTSLLWLCVFCFGSLVCFLGSVLRSSVRLVYAEARPKKRRLFAPSARLFAPSVRLFASVLRLLSLLWSRFGVAEAHRSSGGEDAQPKRTEAPMRRAEPKGQR